MVFVADLPNKKFIKKSGIFKMYNYVNRLDRARCGRMQGWRPITGWRLSLATKLHSRTQSHSSTGIKSYWQMINAFQDKSHNANDSSKKQTNVTSKQTMQLKLDNIYKKSPEQEGCRPGRNWQVMSTKIVLPLFNEEKEGRNPKSERSLKNPKDT